MIYLFLLIIIIELAIDLFFHFKALPDEAQKEVLRKVAPPVQGEVISWQPPEEEEIKTSKQLTEDITK
jgi:hypothetical protein